MKQIKIYDKVYKTRIIVWICDYKEFKKELKKHSDAEFSENAGLFVAFDNFYLIWLNTRLNKKERASVLVHELLHLVRKNLEGRVLMPLSEETEEAYAYYLESLYEEISSKLN